MADDDEDDLPEVPLEELLDDLTALTLEDEEATAEGVSDASHLGGSMME